MVEKESWKRMAVLSGQWDRMSSEPLCLCLLTYDKYSSHLKWPMFSLSLSCQSEKKQEEELMRTTYFIVRPCEHDDDDYDGRHCREPPQKQIRRKN